MEKTNEMPNRLKQIISVLFRIVALLFMLVPIIVAGYDIRNNGISVSSAVIFPLALAVIYFAPHFVFFLMNLLRCISDSKTDIKNT